MADNWDDWDADEYVPALPGAVPGAAKPTGAPTFEDEQLEPEAPKWDSNVPKPVPVRLPPVARPLVSRSYAAPPSLSSRRCPDPRPRILTNPSRSPSPASQSTTSRAA